MARRYSKTREARDNKLRIFTFFKMAEKAHFKLSLLWPLSHVHKVHIGVGKLRNLLELSKDGRHNKKKYI